MVRCSVRVWPRRGIIAVLSPARSVRGVVTVSAPVGAHRAGEDQGAAGVGDVFLAGRAGPDHRAVGQFPGIPVRGRTVLIQNVFSRLLPTG